MLENLPKAAGLILICENLVHCKQVSIRREGLVHP